MQVEKLKPEQALEILRSNGVEVTVEQAAQILELLQLLAAIIIAGYLKNQ